MARKEARVISKTDVDEHVRYTVRIDLWPTWLGRLFGRRHRSTDIYCQYHKKNEVCYNADWKYSRNNVSLKPDWFYNRSSNSQEPANFDAKLVKLGRIAVSDHNANRDPYLDPWSYGDVELPRAKLLKE